MPPLMDRSDPVIRSAKEGESNGLRGKRKSLLYIYFVGGL